MPEVLDRRRMRRDAHAVSCLRTAGDLRVRFAFNIDIANPAAADRIDARVETQSRNGNACARRRVQYSLRLGGLDSLTVDRNPDHRHGIALIEGRLHLHQPFRIGQITIRVDVGEGMDRKNLAWHCIELLKRATNAP